MTQRQQSQPGTGAGRFRRLRDAIHDFARACHESEPLLAAPAKFYWALGDCQAAASFGDAESLLHHFHEALLIFTAHNVENGPMVSIPMLAGAWGRLLAAYGDLVDQQSRLLSAGQA
jgi:hypothetical protein